MWGHPSARSVFKSVPTSGSLSWRCRRHDVDLKDSELRVIRWRLVSNVQSFKLYLSRFQHCSTSAEAKKKSSEKDWCNKEWISDFLATGTLSIVFLCGVKKFIHLQSSADWLFDRWNSPAAVGHSLCNGPLMKPTHYLKLNWGSTWEREKERERWLEEL